MKITYIILRSTDANSRTNEDYIYIDGCVASLNAEIAKIKNTDGYTLFWSESNGGIDRECLEALIDSGRGDLWHGAKYEKEAIDFGNPLIYTIPCWMQNAQSDVSGAVSWRLSFDTLLIRNDIFTHLGELSSEFDSVTMAELEFGYRLIRGGILPIYVSVLNPHDKEKLNSPSYRDQVAFLRHHFSRFWTCWAAWRLRIHSKHSFLSFYKALQETSSIRKLPLAHYERHPVQSVKMAGARVSIIIITLNRYPYLKRLLPQLGRQSVPPLEILVIDDTAEEQRDSSIVNMYSDLPVKFIYPNSGGQCSARNIGIKACQGDFILFMDDDDDEVREDLIERHVMNLLKFKADVSCGEHDEVDALPVNRNRPLRVTDVFPTINTMVTRRALSRSGLFDERMDKGQSEDHDLGMRLYLTGSLMLIDPTLRVLHNRAPIGGLREHRNRIITYSSSRNKVFDTRIIHVTEIYLFLQYFSRHEVKELLTINKWASLSIQGNALVKLVKICVGLLRFSNTSKRIDQRLEDAEVLSAKGQSIPQLLNKLESV